MVFICFCQSKSYWGKMLNTCSLALMVIILLFCSDTLTVKVNSQVWKRSGKTKPVSGLLPFYALHSIWLLLWKTSECILQWYGREYISANNYFCSNLLDFNKIWNRLLANVTLFSIISSCVICLTHMCPSELVPETLQDWVHLSTQEPLPSALEQAYKLVLLCFCI